MRKYGLGLALIVLMALCLLATAPTPVAAGGRDIGTCFSKCDELYKRMFARCTARNDEDCKGRAIDWYARCYGRCF